MAYLLDTTALSELTRRVPDPGFFTWISQTPDSEAFITAQSIGELENGIERLPPGKKRQILEAWFGDLLKRFNDRILPFGIDDARVWGRATARAKNHGVELPAVDAQIAAIASTHGLIVVTRNIRHFDARYFENLELLNPWKA